MALNGEPTIPGFTIPGVSEGTAQVSTATMPPPDGNGPAGTADRPTATKRAAKKASAKTAPAQRAPAKKAPAKKAPAAKMPGARKAAAKAATTDDAAESGRRRRSTMFPASTFEDALELAKAIYEMGAGQSVRRLTLFDNLKKSPESGTTRQWITNTAKYGLITGNYSSDVLALTPDGLQAVADDVSVATQTRARLKLAIQEIDVFRKLYESHLGSRLPAQAVLIDKARELGVPERDAPECIETFTLNTKFVGVLRTISGAERLLPIDQVLDDYMPGAGASEARGQASRPLPKPTMGAAVEARQEDFDTACFYITPIGSPGSDERKHSDLFMGQLVEPALTEFGLRLVRADKIGEAGMITAQIIEHIVHSKLVIVDLSFHNPNVFYELALRHAVRKPIVQITRLADRLPFDVGQFRTVVVDTTDIYTLVPALESLKAEIAAQIRKTLDQQSAVENPLSIFAPYFWDHLTSARSAGAV